MRKAKEKITTFIRWIFSSKKKAVLFIVLILISGFLVYKNILTKPAAPQYQTVQASKGTLISSVSASGTVTAANNVSVTTQASSVVKEVLVKNGDSVTAGQALATLILDQSSQQKQAAAYASYLSAKNSLDDANAKYYSLQNTLFITNQKFINDAVERDLKTDDPTYIEENATWLQAEADYKNQATAISASQASFSAASLNLSQLSSTITAPVAGVVKGLTITPGSVVTVTSSSSSSTSSSQVLGSINQKGAIQAEVDISEIDAVKVSEGDKVTMNLDAFPELAFTGKVASVNTNGTVSSGVTTYPAMISFDTGNEHIYPNMSVTAKIITNAKNNVILVPSAVIQTSADGTSSVRVLRNGQVNVISVEVGDANDTEAEIKSGISEEDIIITGTVASSRNTNITSPFGANNRGMGGFGGGTAARAR